MSHCSSMLSSGMYRRSMSPSTPARRSRDGRRDILRVEDLVAQRVDLLALVVGDVVVLEQLLADVEVPRFDFSLRGLDRARDHRVLDRLALGHLQHHHDAVDALAGEDAQQRVLERHVEARAARVALAAGAAAQLVVDAPRLVALGADDVQAAGLHHLVVQRLPFAAQRLDAWLFFVRGEIVVRFDKIALLLDVAAEHDVGAAAGHVGGDGDHLRPAGLRHDLRLALVLLGVQHLVRQLLLASACPRAARNSRSRWCRPAPAGRARSSRGCP